MVVGVGYGSESVDRIGFIRDGKKHGCRALRKLDYETYLHGSGGVDSPVAGNELHISDGLHGGVSSGCQCRTAAPYRIGCLHAPGACRRIKYFIPRSRLRRDWMVRTNSTVSSKSRPNTLCACFLFSNYSHRFGVPIIRYRDDFLSW